MAFVVIAHPPSRELYEKVMGKLGGADDPPAGLIIHTASEVDGRVRVVDVWESREASEAFDRDKLMPAFAAAGITPEMQAQAQPERCETFDVIRGRTTAEAST
jgi:hypothetical protein